jgi:hypothetical protein
MIASMIYSNAWILYLFLLFKARVLSEAKSKWTFRCASLRPCVTDDSYKIIADIIC